MKVYIAGAYYNKPLLEVLKEFLLVHVPDLEFVSDWLHSPAIEDNRGRFEFDIRRGVAACDLVIATYPYGDGTASEIGYAMGADIPTVYYRTECGSEDELDPIPVGGFYVLRDDEVPFKHPTGECERFIHAKTLKGLISVVKHYNSRNEG